MDKIIDTQEEMDLSGAEVESIIQRKASIIPYHDLVNYNNIDDLLGENKEVIILYESSHNVGHFVSLFIQPDNNKNIEFFDPYGFYPDTELKFATYNHNAYLTDLLQHSSYNLIYNNKRLQKWSSDTNTCGRWSALRLRFKHIPLVKFQYLFTHNECYASDFWVSALTLLYTI